LVEDAEVETLGVQIDSAVVLVLLGVESHRGLLWSKGLPCPRQPTVWVGREGASNQYPSGSSGRLTPHAEPHSVGRANVEVVKGHVNLPQGTSGSCW
jgi:hypothetical protein